MTEARLVPLGELKPAAWNPRSIKDSRFKNLCESIKADPEFMQLRPILATLDGEIIGGNMRYRAVQSLGWAAVPALLVEMDEALAKARALRDNGSWGEWDDDKLGALLEGLKASEVDVSLLGFESKELDRLLSLSQADANGDADAVPPPPAEAVTQRGDLWVMGEHRLLCGDATVDRDVARLGCDKKALLLTDPPYGLSIVSAAGHVGARRMAAVGTYRAVIGDDKPFDPTFLLGLTTEAVLWGGNHYSERLPNSSCWLVWDKRDGMSGNNFADCELAWTNHKGPARLIRHLWSGMIRASEHESRVHPTQKPVAVIQWAIEQMDHSETVVDLFGGSGSTLIAADKLGRRARLMELDPIYCDVIVERWQRLTGKVATRS